MRIEEYRTGLTVGMMHPKIGSLVGEIVGVSTTKVRVQFRDSQHPTPVSVRPEKIWSMEDQLSLDLSFSSVDSEECIESDWLARRDDHDHSERSSRADV